MKQQNSKPMHGGEDSCKKGKRKRKGIDPPIAWHPAFVEAIMLELKDYHDSLEFLPEFQLTAEPLRIDCVVIKKKADIVIRKNIAAIFKDINILEYKSPEDYVSIGNFYKVYGYACLYASLENISVTNITISFIESHYPRELLSHLKKTRGYKVEENSPGIYNVIGDILAIQIIDSRKLSADDNLWLKRLRNKLAPKEMRRLLAEISRQGKAARVGAYLDVIARANKDCIREAFKMSDNQYAAFQEVLEEVGVSAKWEAKGEERKAMKVAQKMINLGLPLETIVSATDLDYKKVEALYQNR